MMAATVTDGLKVWVMRVLENVPTFYLDEKVVACTHAASQQLLSVFLLDLEQKTVGNRCAYSTLDRKIADLFTKYH
jgi:hypothetical protein